MRKIILFVVAFIVSMATCSQTAGKKSSAGGVPFEIKRSVFFDDGLSLDEFTTSEWDPTYIHVNNETRYSASGGMIEQVEFAYSEDKGLITAKIIRDMESRLKNRVVYQYNPQGYLWRESLVDKNKPVYTYEYSYDSKGNKTNRVIKNRAGDKLAETVYTYDSSSKMLTSQTRDFSENAISSTRYSYNAQGNLLKEEVVNGEGKVTSITNYFWQGDLEIKNEMTTPDGKVLLRVSNEYGENGELTKKKIENFQGGSMQTLQYEYVFRPRR